MPPGELWAPGHCFRRAKAFRGKPVWCNISSKRLKVQKGLGLLVDCAMKDFDPTSEADIEFLRQARVKQIICGVNTVTDLETFKSPFQAYWAKVLLSDKVVDFVFPFPHDPFFEGDLIL